MRIKTSDIELGDVRTLITDADRMGFIKEIPKGKTLDGFAQFLWYTETEIDTESKEYWCSQMDSYAHSSFVEM